MIGKKINQLATELAPVSTDLTIIGDPVSGVSKKITLAQLGAIFSGAVSFYNDLASFPATGDINVIYCAKDTKKLYLWSGSSYVEVFPSQALLDTYQLRSEKGVSNGYASLDSGGKVPISQLPSSIMEYKGTWNAATNTPTLANGTGDTGDVYICNVAGTVNFGASPITFAVGDYTIYSGSIWQRSSGAVGTVTSVALSRSGDALAITGSPITTSGTINIGFAGTGTQYIKGDGTLATFPSIISQAQNLVTEVYNSTGATLTKGTIVYINGGQGNLPTVTKALATGDSTSAQTYGIVQTDITNMNNGYVVVAGRLSDLDTQAYTAGTQLYLSATTAGTWTSTKQYAPNHLVYVGIVVRAHPTQGVVEVKIQNGYELDELHNVAAQTPTNNDGLFWETSTSLWKNKSIATILGYTPQAQLNGTGFVKASGTTITYDNSTYLTTSAAATTYLPMVLSSTAKDIDINGQTFDVSSKTSAFTSGRLIVTPTFSALGYQNSGVFNGFKILTDGSAEFSNSGITRFFYQVRFDSTLTNGTYTYTLPGADGTIALVGGAGVGTVTSVGLSSATSGVTIGSTPITTSGTITLAIATASGSQQGLLSSTDWTTFNNKQNALTNPVTGTGTTNYLPKFTGTSTIGNSIVQDNSTHIDIGGYALFTRAGKQTIINPNVGAGNVVADFGVGSGMGLTFTTDVERMRLTSTGNLGLGVTPSAWVASVKSIQIGALGGTVITGNTSAGGSSTFGQNLYYDDAFRYAANGTSSYYSQSSGAHIWYQAPSGTAGNAISFTQAMTLNASGNLSVGNTNDTYKLDVSGTARFTGDVTTTTTYNITNGLTLFGNHISTQWYNGDDTVFVNYVGYNGGTTQFRNFHIYNGKQGLVATFNGSTGAATFSSTGKFNSAITGGAIIFDAATNYGLIQDANSVNRIWFENTGSYRTLFDLPSAGTSFAFRTSAGTIITSITSAGAATFSSSVTAGGTINQTSSAATLILNRTGGTTFGAGVQYQTSGTNNWIVGTGQSTVGTDYQIYNYGLGAGALAISYSNNYVGIGTTSPNNIFTIYAASSAIYTQWIQSGTGTTSTDGLRIGLDASSNGIIDLNEGTALITKVDGSERMRITSGGLVGIGTTSPAAVLEVAGTSSTSDFRISRTVSASTYFYISAPGGSPSTATLGVNGTSVMALKSSQVINFVNVPTSSAGLSSGDIYKDGSGFLKIV